MSNLTEAVTHALDQSEHPEDEAIGLLHYLMGRFGWSGTVMTRKDAESIADRELTEDEWDEVRNTKVWRDAPGLWNESGVTWDGVAEALREAGVA